MTKQEDIEALIDLIKYYRDEYHASTQMKSMDDKLIAELQYDPTSDRVEIIELIVDGWLDS